MNNSVGWECPKCHKVWAPWVQSCDCARHDLNNYTLSDNWQYEHVPEWRRHATCMPSNIEVGYSKQKAKNYTSVSNCTETNGCPNSACANH